VPGLSRRELLERLGLASVALAVGVPAHGDDFRRRYERASLPDRARLLQKLARGEEPILDEEGDFFTVQRVMTSERLMGHLVEGASAEEAAGYLLSCQEVPVRTGASDTRRVAIDLRRPGAPISVLRACPQALVETATSCILHEHDRPGFPDYLSQAELISQTARHAANHGADLLVEALACEYDTGRAANERVALRRALEVVTGIRGLVAGRDLPIYVTAHHLRPAAGAHVPEPLDDLILRHAPSRYADNLRERLRRAERELVGRALENPNFHADDRPINHSISLFAVRGLGRAIGDLEEARG